MVGMVTKSQRKVAKSGREMYFLYATLGIHTAYLHMKASDKLCRRKTILLYKIQSFPNFLDDHKMSSKYGSQVENSPGINGVGGWLHLAFS